jgi:hypothetical protein
MVVSWATPCYSTGVVTYSSDGGNSAQVAATSGNYTFGLYNSPNLYSAVLSGLSLNTTYTYSVGGSASGNSVPMTFVSHPGVGPAMGLHLAVLGDLGQTNNSVSTLAHMAANPAIQAILHAGDLSYAGTCRCPEWWW